MELTTTHVTAALFLSKAMAMPPPSPVARKRGRTEMSHARSTSPTATTLQTLMPPPPPPTLASLHRSNATSRSLAANGFPFPHDDINDRSRCRGFEEPVDDDEDSEAPWMDSLSADAQRFLAEDPFDFEALPHPMLQRQQAILNTHSQPTVRSARDHMYYKGALPTATPCLARS